MQNKYKIDMKGELNVLGPIRQLGPNSDKYILITEGFHGWSNFAKKDGKLLSVDWFDYASRFSEGFSVVAKRIHKNGNLELIRYNYLKEDGSYLSEKWYMDALEFREGFGCVKRVDDGRWNFIREDGSFLSSEWWGSAGHFIDGMARIRRSGTKSFNYIDKNGDVLSDEWFPYAEDIRGPYGLVGRSDNTYNLLLRNGRTLTERWWDSIFVQGNELYATSGHAVYRVSSNGEIDLIQDTPNAYGLMAISNVLYKKCLGLVSITHGLKTRGLADGNPSTIG